MDSDDVLENIEYSTSKPSKFTLHDISIYDHFFKGSPGPAGTGVAGPKGESGERVRSLWKLKIQITVAEKCSIYTFVEVVPRNEVKINDNHDFFASGTSWYQWQTRRQSERMVISVQLAFMCNCGHFNVVIITCSLGRSR